jgi:hypothetical protein
MFTPKGRIGTVPARASSSAKMNFCTGVKPGPPYSVGQDGVDQPPWAPRVRCQAR